MTEREADRMKTRGYLVRVEADHVAVEHRLALIPNEHNPVCWLYLLLPRLTRKQSASAFWLNKCLSLTSPVEIAMGKHKPTYRAAPGMTSTSPTLTPTPGRL
jgi:hypothetical protein